MREAETESKIERERERVEREERVRELVRQKRHPGTAITWLIYDRKGLFEKSRLKPVIDDRRQHN